ncbi:hypothetical protein V5O48_009459 [Marasmius crinis-equi]|uniref:MYND-type domain-containing protein n=1 Tax=Marasmius crinis-equi TaxID=585013 RepID=A0ABR3FB11_9AGAR
MAAFATLAKDFRPKPPGSVDPDRLDQREAKALGSLNMLCDALQKRWVGSSTYHFVEDNWSKIWPWIVSLCRGVVDRPLPLTVMGVEAASQIISIAPVFFTYPLTQPDSSDFYALLKPLLDSTPRVFALATEMWLHGSTIEHRSREYLTNAVGLLLEAHAKMTMMSLSLPPGEATSAFFKVVLDTGRWDVPAVCIRGIISDLTQPPINCYTLRSNLIILSLLARGTSLSPKYIPKLLQKDAVRWAAVVVAKLSSPKNYHTGQGYEFNDVAVSIREAIQFLYLCLQYDAYYAISALDNGILVSIFKLREIITADSHRRHSATSSLAASICLLLNQLTIVLVHQSVLVRALRNFKKIDRLAPDFASASKPFLDDFGSLNDLWAQVRAEASRRNTIRNSDEPYSGRYGFQICGFHQCPLADDQLDASYPFLRCLGCYAEVYCSEECRELAWKFTGPHSVVCKDRRRFLQGGEGREPGNLEYALLRKHLAFDVLANAEAIGQLKDRYYVEHGVQQSEARLITWMDYSKHPIAMEVVTVAQGEKKLYAWARQEIQALDEQVAAIAQVPWRFAGSQPLLVIHRDEGSNGRSREKAKRMSDGPRQSVPLSKTENSTDLVECGPSADGTSVESAKTSTT